MREPDLKKKMELLRKRLLRVFAEKGSFLDPQVIAVSREMDRLIVSFHRRNGFEKSKS